MEWPSNPQRGVDDDDATLQRTRKFRWSEPLTTHPAFATCAGRFLMSERGSEADVELRRFNAAKCQRQTFVLILRRARLRQPPD
jgi:hypothetical protein